MADTTEPQSGAGAEAVEAVPPPAPAEEAATTASETTPAAPAQPEGEQQAQNNHEEAKAPAGPDPSDTRPTVLIIGGLGRRSSNTQ